MVKKRPEIDTERKSHIAGVIRKYRLQAKLEQRELAKLLHVTPAAVGNWERSLSRPDLDTIPLLCRELRISVTELLDLDPEGRYVLFFGFIRGYKGLDLLLDAMAKPEIKAAGIKLMVAGEFYGDSKPYLEQIERLGIKDSVLLFTDFIPDSQVNRYFRACDIVAQPYKSATQSGVTQIAFHFEKPMLVTNVGGLAEIVPDGKIGYVAI